MRKLRIIIGGFLGLFPAGGVTWDYIQYPLGLALLGHDVYYIEDTRLYPVYQKPGSNWNDCTSCVEHLQSVMKYFNMNDRWAYRDEASGTSFGLSETKIKELCGSADIFINISCSTVMREEYLKIPKRILIDSDPMFTQIQYASQQMFTPGQPGLRSLLHAHNYLFTFGENIGANDCLIPHDELQWHTTRQPVCLKFWQPQPPAFGDGAALTTLMNWTAGKKLLYNNEEWGQKDVEFFRFSSLPQNFPGLKFSLIVSKTGGTDYSLQKEKMERAGWKILDPETHADNWIKYQQFIQNSIGEFSVAKETYVKANSGWFSCRSACYLASGRPVVTQDTGWSRFIPSGDGLFAFHDMESAIDAVQQVVSRLEHHSKTAREIAADYFDSEKVLNSLLNKIT